MAIIICFCPWTYKVLMDMLWLIEFTKLIQLFLTKITSPDLWYLGQDKIFIESPISKGFVTRVCEKKPTLR